MSEESGSIENAIKTSVKYAFKSPDLSIAVNRNKLEEETRGWKEKGLKLVQKAAEKLADRPLARFRSELARSIWSSAARRVTEHLTKQAVANADLVMRTLDSIDPKRTALSYVDNGKELYINVRDSMGFKAPQRVEMTDYREEDPKFPAVINKQSQLVLGKNAYERTKILSVIDGEDEYKPMWEKDGVVLPMVRKIYDTNTGKPKIEAELVWLNTEQITRLREKVTPDQKIEQAKPLIDKISYGGHSIASPDHPNEDGFGNARVDNSKGEQVALRIINVDGSGGALSNSGLPENVQVKMIQDKVNSIKKDIAEANYMTAKAALESADKNAQADTNNPAYASVVVVDICSDTVEIARMGDNSVTRWRPDGYGSRRGEGWKNRGNPSNFQSIDQPQNVAYLKKNSGEKSETGMIEDLPDANYILGTVGGPDKKGSEAKTLTVDRSDQTEFLLICSDGARGSGTMLEPNTAYSQEVNRIMTNLNNGFCSEKDAAKDITLAARNLNPGERDDITVQVVRLPPKSI